MCLDKTSKKVPWGLGMGDGEGRGDGRKKRKAGSGPFSFLVFFPILLYRKTLVGILFIDQDDAAVVAEKGRAEAEA